MNRQQISFYYPKSNPTNVGLTQRRQSCPGTQCQKTLQHFFKFSINEKTPATYLSTFYNIQTSAFSNRGADSCRVDLSPMIRALYLLFTFSRSFRNHTRPSEVHGPQVKYFPRHKYMLHSLENLAQPGGQPESVYGLFFFGDWHDLTASLLFIYTRFSCDRTGRIYTEMLSICSAFPHHLYHAGTVPCRKHHSLHWFASFAGSRLPVSAQYTPSVLTSSSQAMLRRCCIIYYNSINESL